MEVAALVHAQPLLGSIWATLSLFPMNRLGESEQGSHCHISYIQGRKMPPKKDWKIRGNL